MGKMHDAVKNRDLNLLLECIEAGDDIHQKLEGEMHPFNKSPFMMALYNNVFSGKKEDAEYFKNENCSYYEFYTNEFTNVEAMRIFLTHPMTRGKVELNKKDYHGRTLIFKCLNVEILNLLYSFGAAVNVKDNHGYTPLFYALIAGRKILAKQLIELNANYKYVIRNIHEKLEEAKDSSDRDKIKELKDCLNILKEIFYERDGCHYYNVSEIEFDLTKWLSKHLKDPDSPIMKEFVDGISCEIYPKSDKESSGD